MESNRQIKKQVVAGFVIFRRTEDGVKYLLLYRRGQYWNFPKGHFELGEASLDTALRETKEETGIGKEDLRIISDFRAYEKFSFDRGNERIFDTVILYLAETKKVQVTIVPREHSGYAWFLYHDALKVVGKQYAGTKRVLRLANEFIKGKQRRPAGPPQAQHAHPTKHPSQQAERRHEPHPGQRPAHPKRP
ncbi:MAG: NUDIX domain-containing protein [Candidatus Liptonbacteria bacterium]|nr:NUDIX domain-containing protein [Candidatus Liptonbacteria bacterium]